MTTAPWPRLGIRMDGTEARFLSLILERARAAPSFSFFELGTAEGQTLAGVYQVLVREGIKDFKLVGCDLPNGWSCNRDKLASNMNATGLPYCMYSDDRYPPHPNAAHIYFVDGRVLIKALNERHGFMANALLIDGCHGRACVMADFLAVEPYVSSGGLVSFHDACVLSQHTDMQDHCREPINVRQALKDLGLLDNQRPGWEFVEEIAGSRAWGGDGNGHVVVRKT